MGDHAKQNNTPPAPAGEAGAAERRQEVGHDRRVVRTVDLTEQDIAAIEASEMTPGYEQLDAELEPKPTSVVEQGARFARELGQRGQKTAARRAGKVFRDSLYDDS